MADDPWDRLQPLFEEALSLPPDYRRAFAQDACPDDPELRDALLALLASADAPAPLLDHDLGHAVVLDVALDGLAEAETPPDRVGPWAVGERIGAGGMGAVYRARRAEGDFDQTVALKLVKRGMDSEAVLRRFRSERRILARLEHPGIARVVDGGLADDGRPFLAMEYVDGTPLTEVAADLPLDARLDLFCQVCDAVHYAHRQLVVHRDLKPSNILVDGEGRVKLLDFGIARVLQGDDDEPTTVLTVPGQLMLTPEYAAPEQLTGGAITTATDVYALGVVLYEMLTGTRPYAFETRSPSAIERVVLTTQPARPSTVVRGDASTPRQALSGDLDVICLQALRKEPERRYGSAQALGEDIRRFQANRPVQARPDSVGYRARTFARRQRVPLAAAAVALVAIVAVTALSFVRVSAERDRAEVEAVKAREVSAFLSDLFTSSNPAESRGADISARDLLARGADRIEADLADQPQVQAQMWQVVGEVHLNLGLYAQAESLLTRALSLRESQVGPDAPEVAETLDALGKLYERRGQFPESDATHERSAAIYQADPETYGIEWANALHGQSWARLRLGDYDRAEALIEHALDLKTARLGTRHADVAYSLNVLGDVYTHQGRYDLAEATHRRALALRRELLGPDHLDAAYSLHNLAAALRDAERWPEAEAAYRESLDLWRIHFGEASQEYGNTLSQLAQAVGMQGRYAEEQSMHDQAMASLRASVGDDHPKVPGALSRHARVLERQGRRADAADALRQALVRERRRDETHPNVAAWLVRLATLVDSDAEAARLLAQSDALCRAHQPGDTACLARVRDARAGRTADR